MDIRPRGLSRWRRRPPAERGAVALEFALLLPVLLLLVFGIIQYGMLFGQYLAVGNSTRQGARYGVVSDRTCAQIVSEIKNSARAPALKWGNIKVEIRLGDRDDTYDTAALAPGCTEAGSATSSTKPCQDSDPGDQLFVHSKYQGQILLPIPSRFLNQKPNLQAIGVYRCEYR